MALFSPPSIVTVALRTSGPHSSIPFSHQDQDLSIQDQVLENSPMPTVSSAWRILLKCFAVVKLKI